MVESEFVKLRNVARWHLAFWVLLVIAATYLIKLEEWWPVPTAMFVLAFFPGPGIVRLALCSKEDFRSLSSTQAEQRLVIPTGSLKGLVGSWNWFTKGLLVAVFGLFALFGAWMSAERLDLPSLMFTGVCALVSGYVASCWMRSAVERKK